MSTCIYKNRISPVPNQGATEYGWNVFQPWEQEAIGEISAIKVGNTYYAAYTAGWTNGAIGTATSTDGIYWTKNTTPVIGQGYCSEAGFSGRCNLIYINGEFRIYYSNELLFYAYSSDFVNWQKKTPGVVLSGQIPGTNTMANQGVWIDPATGKWWILMEFGTVNPQWQTYLLTSEDNGATFQYSLGPLTSLRTGPVVYGGPSKIHYSNGKWHVLYHSSMGTTVSQIWHAETTDISANSWVFDSSPFIPFSDQNYCGLEEADQVADPDFLDLSNGTGVIFFNAVNNDTGKAQIGEYVFPGDSTSLFSCPFVPYSFPGRPVITFLKK